MKKISIETQLNAILKHCNRNGLTIKHIKICNTENIVYAMFPYEKDEEGGGYPYMTYYSLIKPEYSDLIQGRSHVSEQAGMFN